MHEDVNKLNNPGKAREEAAFNLVFR